MPCRFFLEREKRMKTKKKQKGSGQSKDGIVFLNSDKKGYDVLRQNKATGRYTMTHYVYIGGDTSKSKMRETTEISDSEAKRLLRKSKPGWLVPAAALFLIFGGIRLYEGLVWMGAGGIILAAVLLLVYLRKPKI